MPLVRLTAMSVFHPLRTFTTVVRSDVLTLTLAGHSVEFNDCMEVGQGGPETCTMSIDGELVTLRYLWGLRSPRRFHPSPLEWCGEILVPLRESVHFYLARVNPLTLNVTKLGGAFSYMRLLSVTEAGVEFSTWFDDRETRFVRLD